MVVMLPLNLCILVLVSLKLKGAINYFTHYQIALILFWFLVGVRWFGKRCKVLSEQS